MQITDWTREKFEQKIKEDWTAYFESDPRAFEKSGSSYLKREHYAEGRMIIAHAGSRTFVQYHPGVERRIVAFAKLCPPNLALTADHFLSYFGNQQIRVECLDYLYYLYPADLNLPPLAELYSLRKLTKEDQPLLAELNNACTEEEVENSFVSLDELGTWGCFIDDHLVSAAGYSDWGLYADFGVITHPQHRKGGLAKAAVAAGCREALEKGKIPIYRCHITLFPSIRTAAAVGFRKYPRVYFKMEVLKFVD